MRGWRRTAERRRAIGSLLREVSASLPGMRDMRQLRRKFEAELRALLNVRNVDLRDGPATPTPIDAALSVDVAAGSLSLGAIDLTFDRTGGTLDAWDVQVLDDARYVAALVLLLDRAYKAGTLAATRSRFDGAAPIIGSSAAIRARPRAHRARRGDRFHRPHRRRERRRQGAGRAPDPRAVRRRDGPFVAVNCAAIVETLLEAELFGIEDRIATGVRGRRGKFEHAHERHAVPRRSGGPLAGGAGEAAARDPGDVGRAGRRHRRAAGRHADHRRDEPELSELVARGRFRLDLFYRLHGVEIVVPPLRERPEDILELARVLPRAASDVPARCGCRQAAADALLAYAWPGNVRELERVIERAVALADSRQLQLDDLPPALLDGYARGAAAVVPAAAHAAPVGRTLCAARDDRCCAAPVSAHRAHRRRTRPRCRAGYQAHDEHRAGS